ncbi:unnamed protein product [Dibothriocephalus latus]|uniref:Uncharacterized protein n=1 Tax=Dibothriocephalus latus TaxID=60516 RepID=A0A3P6QGZ8_DIBLA|nr:unnamed protein product [Dibothriocephalus latus]
MVLENDVAWVLALLAARFGEQRPKNDGDEVRVAKQRRLEQHFNGDSSLTTTTTTTVVGDRLEVRGLQYPPVQLSTKEDKVSTYSSDFSPLLFTIYL